MPKKTKTDLQITPQNILPAQIDALESLAAWIEAYFQFEVTTLESSQKEQRRDLRTFLEFFIKENDNDRVGGWSPRLTQAFKTALQKETKANGTRRRGDRTINRLLATVKTFAKWVHKHRPFPLGDPTRKLKLLPTASLLAIERAITAAERRRILDAADLLLTTGGRSRDRHRFRKVKERPRRKGYRPYRNRAIVYMLIETGIRRKAVTRVTANDVDFDKRSIRTIEKGGVEHYYQISQEGLGAVRDYLDNERLSDTKYFKSPALFLPAETQKVRSDGWLTPDTINSIWNQVCKTAGVKGKTPHSARHGMGRHLIEKTGNIEAVQRQLGHKNAAYSLQYSRITQEELNEVLDDRS